MRSKTFLLSLVVLFSAITAQASGSQSLFPLYGGKDVKVYIAEVKDSTKEHEVGPSVLRTAIEDALKNRKSITFHSVPTPEEADLLIEVNIQEFMWTDHDPVDMLMGAAATAYDIATVEDYARLQAEVAVTDLKSKKILWKERVMGTITKKPMSRVESIPLVTASFAKAFVKQCFSKKRE